MGRHTRPEAAAGRISPDMSTLDDWLIDSARALGLDTPAIPADLRNELLDLTRDVAHGVARIAGPLTCYQVGLAVGRGAAPSAALAAVADLARARLAQSDTADGDAARPSSAPDPAVPGGDTAVPAAREAVADTPPSATWTGTGTDQPTRDAR
jgi:hypothetical protein